MEPVFSIVIPTHNRAELVRRTLQAFLAQEGPAFEVIVVDDGSTDATPQVLQAIGGTRVRVVRQPNQGLAAARNAGFALAQGRYVLFNDDDVIPEPHFLLAHRRMHQQFDRCAAVSRTHIPDALGQRPFVRFWRERAEGGVRGKPNAAPLGRGGFWFASLSLPRAELPPQPFAAFKGYGWEEHELGLRLWRRGIRPRLAAEARAAHEDRVSLEATTAKVRSMGRMAWEFLRQHPGWDVALWTGANPLAMTYQRLAYPWPRAERLLRDLSWESGPGAFRNYRFVLSAAYVRGLLEGRAALSDTITTTGG